MFIPREGYKLIVADYSQMELRMLAHYSKDKVLLDAFERDLDLHIVTGSRQGGKTYEELLALVDADDDEGKKLRSIGKTSNFALTYGMAGPKYQLRLAVDNKLKIPLKTAESWIRDYEKTYAQATAWKLAVVKYAKVQGGFIRTISGRKRRIPDLFSTDRLLRSHAERQAVNAVIQGSCADLINEVIPYIQRALRAIGGYVLLQVHDEIVCEVPTQFVETGKAIVENIMKEYVNSKYNLRCPMIATAHVGDSWGDAKG